MATDKTIYILFSVGCDNEKRIEAVTSNWWAAKKWQEHRGHHFEEYELDYLDEIRWALK